MMEEYNKPPLKYEEQIALLKSRGMVFPDEVCAKNMLANVCYYRLSAYMLPYKEKADGKILDEFRDGTTWDKVCELYMFDRKLRLLVFDAIERLEVAIRSQIIYQLCDKYGSHWQDRSEIFKPRTEKVLFIADMHGAETPSGCQRHCLLFCIASRYFLFMASYNQLCSKYLCAPCKALES